MILGRSAKGAIRKWLSPFLKWTLAVIAGGGIAGLVQGATVVARGASSARTGGLASPVLATAELGASLVSATLSIVMPALAVVTFAGLCLDRFDRSASRFTCHHNSCGQQLLKYQRPPARPAA